MNTNLKKQDVFHRYDIDIDNITITMNRFNRVFSNFLTLEINDKIYFDTSQTIQINKPDISGRLYRWANSINRNNTIIPLIDVINDLLKFNTMIYMYMNKTMNHMNILLLICKQVQDLLTGIMRSIDILRKTYSDDDELCDNLQQLNSNILKVLVKF